MYLNFEYLKTIFDCLSYVGGLLIFPIFISACVQAYRRDKKGTDT